MHHRGWGDNKQGGRIDEAGRFKRIDVTSKEGIPN